MRVYHIVMVAILGGTALPIALHHQAHGRIDVDQAALAFFLWLNFIIALWELCLLFRIEHIEKQHARFIVDYKGRELDRVKDFFMLPVPLGKIFSPTVWAELWSSYSVFDPSYADRKSFGFWIDVGNGFSTAFPALLCIYGMTYEFLPARALGIILVVLNYQIWYGTLVYFASFVFNKRYAGHKPINVAVFVVLINGLWFTFPLWAIYAGVTMIYSGSYGIFR
jgi:hypothetical protein